MENIKAKKKYFLKESRKLFKKYNVSQADQVLFHKFLRGYGMLKKLIAMNE